MLLVMPNTQHEDIPEVDEPQFILGMDVLTQFGEFPSITTEDDQAGLEDDGTSDTSDVDDDSDESKAADLAEEAAIEADYDIVINAIQATAPELASLLERQEKGTAIRCSPDDDIDDHEVDELTLLDNPLPFKSAQLTQALERVIEGVSHDDASDNVKHLLLTFRDLFATDGDRIAKIEPREIIPLEDESLQALPTKAFPMPPVQATFLREVWIPQALKTGVIRPSTSTLLESPLSQAQEHTW